MPANDYLLLKNIFSEALKRYEIGEERYGQFSPEEDSRDLLAEAEAEILDGINYLGMFLMKLRRLKSRFTED
jgi:hypothetical protein